MQQGRTPDRQQQQQQQQPNLYIVRLGYRPVRLICPFCNTPIITRVQVRIGGAACLACSLICMMGFCIPFLWFGCCLIPFCLPPCQDYYHFCPNCGRFIGRNY